jgi:hypothetical protein
MGEATSTAMIAFEKELFLSQAIPQLAPEYWSSKCCAMAGTMLALVFLVIVLTNFV